MSINLSRRNFLKASTLALGGGLAFMTGCTPAAQPGAAGKKGGVLKVVTINPINPVTPHVRGNNMTAMGLAIFDTLVHYDDKGVPQPHLAESWEWSSDHLKLTMRLRKGVKYHTGRAFTSEDVEKNIKIVQDAKTGSQMRASAILIKEMQRPDANTIVMVLEKPNLAFFDMFESTYMMDPETEADLKAGKQIIGTGPFKVKSFDPGTKLVLERNPDYWLAGKPYLDGIEFTTVQDSSAGVLNLESGAAQLALNGTFTDAKRLMADKKYTVLISSVMGKNVVGVNILAPFLADKRVRQGLNWAIPRARYAELVNMSMTEPTSIPWAPISPAYDKTLDQTYSYDLEKAKAAFKAANFSANGTALTITYSTSDENKKFCVMYQEALTQLGFVVKLEPVPGAEYTTRLSSKKMEHLYVGGHANNAMFPMSLLVENFPYRAGDNASSFRSDEYEKLVKDGSLEFDEAKRKEIYTKATKLILDESFVMPYTNNPGIYLMDASVKGLAYNKFDIPMYENVTLG